MMENICNKKAQVSVILKRKHYDKKAQGIIAGMKIYNYYILYYMLLEYLTARTSKSSQKLIIRGKY